MNGSMMGKAVFLSQLSLNGIILFEGDKALLRYFAKAIFKVRKGTKEREKKTFINVVGE